MILVDTSVWVEHIRGKSTPIEDLLGQSRIALHPFVFGELMLMGLPKSGPFAEAAFSKFAEAVVARTSEVAAFIKWAKLAGKGVGYVDAHILMSARLMPDARILTLDSDLLVQAMRFDIAYEP